MSQIFTYDGSGRSTTRDPEHVVDPEGFFRKQSMGFIQEVKRFHGGDMAKAVIEKLSEALGKEWGHNIIYDLVARDTEGPSPSGMYPVRFTFEYFSGSHPNFINVIKEIRGVTGMGLKEAKDAADQLKGACEAYYRTNSDPLRAPSIEISCGDPTRANAFARGLRSFGGVRVL